MSVLICIFDYETFIVMKPEFRIKENEKGKFEVYYIESLGFRCKEILKPYVTWSGLDKVYEFDTIESAIRELQLEVIKNTERA